MYLLLMLSAVIIGAYGQSIDLKGRYICKEFPGNKMYVDVFIYDANGVTVRLQAVDSNDNELTSCIVTGSGSISVPFYVETRANMNTDTEETSCGMTTRRDTNNNNLYYVWRFKAFRNGVNDPVVFAGFVMNIECNKDSTKEGTSGTIIEFNIPFFAVEPLNTISITGTDSFATGSSLKLVGNLFSNGKTTPTQFQDAVGIYFYSCFSATNSGMTQTRQEIVDVNGCSRSSNTFGPSGNTARISTSDEGRFTIEGSSFTATVVNDRNQVYITCLVGKCLTANHPFCENRCNAFNNGASSLNAQDTGRQFSDSFFVVDQPATVLAPTTTGTPAQVLDSAQVGNSIKISLAVNPGGLGAPPAMAGATGFYVTNCQYSTSSTFLSPVTFIDNGGCPVAGTKFTPSSGFNTDQTGINSYVLSSGAITIQEVDNYRVYVRCQLGKCTNPNHNYCKSGGRCEKTNNIPEGFENIGLITPAQGNKGATFSLAVVDAINTPALQLRVQTDEGNAVSTDPNRSAQLGQQLSFSAVITPQGTGSSTINFGDAKGIFLHTCYGERNGIRQLFVDANGCRVSGSRYATSKQCSALHDDGKPPFVVDCGSFTAIEEGDVERTCEISVCTVDDEPACKKPCGTTNPNNSPNVRSNVASLVTDYSVEKEDLSRTAIRAEEMRALIIAVTVVAPVVLIACVAIITFLVIRSQMSGLK